MICKACGVEHTPAHPENEMFDEYRDGPVDVRFNGDEGYELTYPGSG